MRKSMKKIIKKLILLFCLALCITDNLTACSRSDIKKTKSNTETGYKITWYANVLQKNISNEYEVTDKIICNSEYNDAGVRIVYAREDKKSIEIPVMYMILIDGKPVEFSIDNKEKNDIQYINIINGEDKIFPVNFKSVGDNISEHSMVFLAVPYYNIKTQELSDNTIMYCKKTISNEIDISDKDILQTDTEYKMADSTMKICGKELYEISEYNGSVKDYLIYDNDKIKYIGDYPNKNGKTYIVVDGKFYKENDILYCLEWQNNKRYVYKEFTMCDLLSEKHIIFAITIMEDEIVVAHKSFNEEIIKPDK